MKYLDHITEILLFKSFLHSIAYSRESAEGSSKRAVLLEYLQSQLIHASRDSSTHLPDLIRTWHFATQANVENLYSSVVAVLALLLKIISPLIEFRECGIKLCQSLLQDNQIRLFDRGLGAARSKKHLISTCLRLLTEIVSFDGGRVARIVYHYREITFQHLDVFLRMREDVYGEAGNHRKPSIRNNALQYLVTNIKLQNPTAKMHILTQRRVIQAVFEYISEDSAGILLELLDALQKDIAMEDSLPHHVKGRIFNEWVLGCLATLYGYDKNEKLQEGRVSVRESAHNLLLFLCTSSGGGVLEIDEQDVPNIEDNRSGAFALVDRQNAPDDDLRRKNRPKQGNPGLLTFLQGLRPHASVLQAELVLAVFCKAPSIVPEYFARKKSFSFEPKATATWVGYALFLLDFMRLPLPKSLGPSKKNGGVSPPFNTVIDRIIPPPLSQKVMTRCLNQSMDLIKLLSITVIIAAFERFEKALCIRRSTHDSKILSSDPKWWHQDALDLTNAFCSRVPNVEHVVAQLRHCPRDKVFLLENLSRLLVLYYKLLPQETLGTKLDVSLMITGMLQENPEEHSGHRLELDHIIQIAHFSPYTQWWHKAGASIR